MKIISSPKSLEKEFQILLKNYSKYYWSTAWASAQSKAFECLKRNENKIEQIIVGIHFYQTHPDFIETFYDNNKVKYIKQPQGTFHPKIFLFYNNVSDWKILIGSPNFTNAAFTVNTEISTLISQKDLNSTQILKETFKFINKNWQESTRFSLKELEGYKIIWKNLKSKRDSLSGNYGNNSGSTKRSKPLHLTSIAKMDWKSFVSKVKNERYNTLDERIKVLNTAKELFKNTDSFLRLELDERKFIAGIPNKLNPDNEVDWGYFGSMKGAGVFKNRIIQNDVKISNALNEIPKSGQITKIHYDRFLYYYTQVFEGNYLATASRLLAMKRPDVFVCLASKNKSLLCKDFGIIQSGMDYERYWSDIILRIYDSEWWLNPKPKNRKERFISDGRAAFLDSLYYKE